jgi:ribosomal protein L19E
MENKTSFLEEIKEKNKREYLEKIRTLEATLETVQKNRMAEKNQYDSLSNDNIAKL